MPVQGHENGDKSRASLPSLLVFLQNIPSGEESSRPPVSEEWTSPALWLQLKNAFARIHSVAFDEEHVNPDQPAFTAIAADLCRYSR